ncbi:lecithin retinol acyltransferase family protein [Synechococcus sp. AH-551-A10]|nr:lecithin retinol acyltransferase family protein [Synechococcus sp. AH-551-A10]MBL6792482.1 lecithin retinol acyltransferase family protein [Synechococcus sp. BS307-5m-G35]MDB4682372.1 lecithin retinol acyltransferase family protein [Synechococcus sp. AH-551-A10]RCL58679.1 MAG: NC domain protein [Synechococcus sp. MED-G69]
MATADHLQVPRRHGLFNHHGIDLGDGTVAHYLEGREILRSPISEFSQGEVVSVLNHANASPAGVTLRRAMGRLGEQNYNLLFNNCEHFATWCKTGRHRSGQVDSVIDRARQWSRLMPSALLGGLDLLVRRGVLDDNTRQIASQGLAKLEQLRQMLLQKLEGLLLQIGSDGNKQLLLTGQSLADELAAVEDLQRKIDALLNQPRKLPSSKAE